jgi:hypothetical protein
LASLNTCKTSENKDLPIFGMLENLYHKTNGPMPLV